MYTVMNGWTKEGMKQAIRDGNNGTRSFNAVRSLGLCAYRGYDGNKCAVGCFIPDHLYDPSFDKGMLLEGVITKIGDHLPLNGEALIKLQCIHDEATTEEDTRDLCCNWIDLFVD